MLELLLTSLNVLADSVAAAEAAPAQAPVWMQFVPFIIIIGVFYVFLIRPQAKRQKEAQEFLSSLKVGDQVITQSGILGRITGLNEQVATLEVAHDVQIKVLRAQILLPQSSLQTKKEGK